ncbi:MAG: MBL fold metallo-hydrolase [Longimicrobiales bacterium]|nr:MBL fold metallo-hydrolase [Longimicrobiales bacterium]
MMKLIPGKGLRWPSLLFLVLCGFGTALGPEGAKGQEPPAEIAKDVFLLPGLGSNVVAVVNGEGVLLIDNGQSNRVESLLEQVSTLGSGPVEIGILTHFHFDHVGASRALGEAGATLISHENARDRMSKEWDPPDSLGFRYGPIAPYPESALPVFTFDNRFQAHFGTHEIEAVHFPNAHSDADIAVFVRDRNVVHTGDLYLSNGFPIIDCWYGGSIDGQLAALDGLIELIDEETIVVPGHGPLSDRAGLQAYREMLGTGSSRIAALIADGLTLEEVVERDPTAGLYEGGDSWLDPRLFVLTVFMDLTGEGRHDYR